MPEDAGQRASTQGVPGLPRRAVLRAVTLVCFLAGGLTPGLGGCDRSPTDESAPAPTSAPLKNQEGRSSLAEPTEAPDRLQPAEGRPRIVAFGDSLTAGLGVAAEDTYPAQLQRRLNQAGYRYEVVNAGVSGETTAGGLRRVDWVLKSRPALVIVELGANDGLRGLSLDATRTNLDEIVGRLRAAGVTVVLAGMKLPPNYGRDYIGQFEGIYPDLARRHGVALMPFFLEGVAAQPALNQPDGIHPTAQGYKLIVDRLWPILEPLLTKEAARKT
jgi:acyl-CoA thioesterase-1